MTQIREKERAEAALRGVKRYFTGRPCPAGHNVERYTLNGGCVECQRLNCEANRQKVKAAARGRKDAA